MWTALFLAELVLRRALNAAQRLARSWYPLSRARLREAAEEAMCLSDAWREVLAGLDSLAENDEQTILRPASRVRPYTASVPVRWLP